MQPQGARLATTSLWRPVEEVGPMAAALSPPQCGPFLYSVRGALVELTPMHRGVLETGGDRRAFDVPLQPFPD